MRTVLGKVVGLTGTAEVVDQHGQHRVLKAGDTLHEGDQLVTVAGAQVGMQAANGDIVQFAEHQSVKLTDALLDMANPTDISEYAVNPAVIHHLLAALQLNDAIELSPPLASMLQEEGTGFVSIAHNSITESTLQRDDALNINDVLISENQVIAASTVLPITELADLMTQSPSDIGLPGSPLKDFLND